MDVTKITTLAPGDFDAVRRLHEKSGFDYIMPDLASPLFVVKYAAKDPEGRVLGAAGLRVQAETYLWLDPDLPVRVRYRVVLQLSRVVTAEAWRVGLDCLAAWLPPSLPRSFRRLLVKLGWGRDRDGWDSWSKEIR